MAILKVVSPSLSTHKGYSSRRKMGKERQTITLPPAWIMVLLHFRVGLSLYVILKHVAWELEGSWRLLLPPFSKVNTLNGCGQAAPVPISPKGQASRLPHSWLKNIRFIEIPHYDWGDHRWSRVHWESSAGKVTHPSTKVEISYPVNHPLAVH